MKYIVVRTTVRSCSELQKLFEEGWQYKCCHQCECEMYGSGKLCTCLEYILYKK